MGHPTTSPPVRADTAEREAAAWHGRLGERAVSSETIEAYFAWRSVPENAEAYQRVERAWAVTGKLESDPEISAVLDAAMAQKPNASRPTLGPRSLLGLAAIGAALVVAVGGWAWLQSRTVFTTAVGEQRLVQLADGSSVRLDTATRIRVRFAGDQRLVDLEQGQALFSVEKDPERPFIVQAGGASVTAVGTVFDVRRDGEAVSVTLVSGAVDVKPVTPGRPTQRMAAGQRAHVTSAALVTRAVDAEAETQWTQGRIVFRDTPLRQAVSEVNRYLTDKIELEAGTIGAVPVNGVFKTGDRDAFVSTASQVFDLEVSPGPGGSVRLSQR